MATLSTSQARLQDDLRGAIKGDVCCDELTLQLYSTDASMFECRPLGVIWPRSVRDVVAAVRYAAEKEIPIHARGCGTGNAGGAIGTGLVLDFTRYMRRMLHADDETVTILPGVVRERLNILLRRTKHRFFAPSAGHFPTGTVGSILSTDCVGPRWLKYGFPHDYIQELEIVTPDGQIHVIRPEQIKCDESGHFVPVKTEATHGSLLDNPDGLWQKLLSIVQANRQNIKLEQTDDSPDCSGYRLQGVLKNDSFDPTGLIAGSEGTLGIITRATLKTSPLSSCSGAIVFLFDSLEKAARSVTSILRSKPTLCDMIDRRMINMVCEWDKRFLPVLPSDAEVVMIVEIDAANTTELNDRMNQLAHRIRQIEKLSFGSWFAFHQVEKEMFRDLLRKARGTLLRIRHSYQIVSLLEDVQVPVRHLPQFLFAAQNILKRHGVTYSISGHLGHGQVRVQPILNPSRIDFQPLAVRLANELFDEVFKMGGTVGSAQGTALARSFALVSRYPKLSHAFVEIKNLFDPNNIFNPGKIVTDDMRRVANGDSPKASATQSYWTVPFRTRFVPPRQKTDDSSKKPVLKDQLELQLKWDMDVVQEPTFQCNGCGLCRIRTGETRMCPVFRTRTSEEASCRAKPNLLRGIIDGKLSLESLTDDETKRLADACISCHSCQAECPAQVDIPELVFRIKSAYNASHGISLRDRIMANAGSVLSFFSFFNGPVNCVLSKRLPRWIIRQLLTIAPGTKLPALVKGGLFKGASWRRKYARPTRRHEQRVALFLDVYANYFDDKLVEAAVHVLEHNNIEVLIPPRQKESGHEAFSFGHGDRAESLVQHNVNVFADLVRQRYTIVTLEPVSAVCLKKEYAYVRTDEETAAIAANTVDLCDYLYRLHLDGKLQLDFNPVRYTLGYHAPCRTLALTGESVALATPAQELLHLIPGLNVNRIERGCCGLAGGIGLIGENHKMTLKLGMPLTLALRDGNIALGATECNTCKLQLEQRIDKPILHPVKILAYAYGLMPELGPLLSKLQ